MKIQFLILMILSTLFLLNCEKENEVSVNQASMGDYTINYGTSFGMCVGPCKKELNIANSNLLFTVYYNEGRGAVGGNPITYKEVLDADFQSTITKNLNYESFKKLNEVIGCPDCADGGAEWVEIVKGDSKYKVTFEYNKPPKEIETLVKTLREKKEYFEQKYIK